MEGEEGSSARIGAVAKRLGQCYPFNDCLSHTWIYSYRNWLCSRCGIKDTDFYAQSGSPNPNPKDKPGEETHPFTSPDSRITILTQPVPVQGKTKIPFRQT